MMTYFFGYGAFKDKDIFKEIIGHYPLVYFGGLISNFDLGYQILTQIPEKPRQILERIWGTRFRAYTLAKGKGIVTGNIYEITYDDFLLIDRWEFIKEWREFIKVEVTLFNGNKIEAYTTKTLDSQKIEELVDGINYETNLNPQGKKALYENSQKINEIEMIRKQIEIMKIKEKSI
jgi:hypothetical protein